MRCSRPVRTMCSMAPWRTSFRSCRMAITPCYLCAISAISRWGVSSFPCMTRESPHTPRFAPPREAQALRSAAGHFQEDLVAPHVALVACALLRAFLGALHAVPRLLQARLDVGAVDLVRGVRLLDEHQRRVVDHLEVALALCERDHVALGLVEP